jgi:hypothetical protein
MKIRRLTGSCARLRHRTESQCLPQTKSDDTNGAIHPELTDVRSGDQSQMTEAFPPLRRRWAASIILRLATAMSHASGL